MNMESGWRHANLKGLSRTKKKMAAFFPNLPHPYPQVVSGTAAQLRLGSH